ncbi:hypothetical protein [Pseudovibrio brasiliensis]|uniref:Chromosome partition protein Smc n=1 Tax=Pseudovibrio brasiliensis TaxID=1898042 RepID=A0ABX8AXT4_9HYPH|nr:hypothetical protein [Pseudovibrio brasiliensis]QUS58434.1 hypothetical protein KGB56_22155 [Pseudovibrio brasiliensis]
MAGNVGKGSENASPPQVEAWIVQMQGALGLSEDGGDEAEEVSQLDGTEMAGAFGEVPDTDPQDIPEPPPHINTPEHRASQKLRRDIEQMEDLLRAFYTKAQMMWESEHREVFHVGMTMAKQLNSRANVDLSIDRFSQAQTKYDTAKAHLDELEKNYRLYRHAGGKLLKAQIGDEKQLPRIMQEIEQAGLQREAEQLADLEEEITRTYIRAQDFCKDELANQLDKQNELVCGALEKAFKALSQSNPKEVRQYMATTHKHFLDLKDVYKQGYQPLRPQVDEFIAFATKQKSALLNIANQRCSYEVWGSSLRKFDQAFQRVQQQVLALEKAAGDFEIEEATRAQSQLENELAALQIEQDNLEQDMDAQRATLQQIITTQTTQFDSLTAKLQQVANIEELDENVLQEFRRAENTLNALSRLAWGTEGWRVSEMTPLMDASLERLEALVAGLDAGGAHALEDDPSADTEKETAAANALTKQFQKLKAEVEQYYANWSRALEGEFETDLNDLFDKIKEITPRFSKSCAEKDLPVAQAALEDAANVLAGMQQIKEQAKASLTTIDELVDYYDCALTSLYCNRANYRKWDLDLTEIDSACTFIDQQVDALRDLQSSPGSAEAQVLTQQIEHAYKDGCKALEDLEAQALNKKHRILAYYNEHLEEISRLSNMANQLEDAAYYQFLEKSEIAREAINKLLPASNGGDVFKLRSLLAQIDSLMDELRELLADVSSDVEEASVSSSQSVESEEAGFTSQIPDDEYYGLISQSTELKNQLQTCLEDGQKQNSVDQGELNALYQSASSALTSAEYHLNGDDAEAAREKLSEATALLEQMQKLCGQG